MKAVTLNQGLNNPNHFFSIANKEIMHILLKEQLLSHDRLFNKKAWFVLLHKGAGFLARTPLASILQKSFVLAGTEWKKQHCSGQAAQPGGICPPIELVTIEKEK